MRKSAKTMRYVGFTTLSRRLALGLLLVVGYFATARSADADLQPEPMSRALVAEVARIVQAGGAPVNMASQVKGLIEELLPNVDERTRNQIFALALAYTDDAGRVLLAEQILEVIVPGDARGDADAVTAAIMPVFGEIPPVPAEQVDRDAAAASLMIALGKLVPLEVYRTCSGAIAAAASAQAPSILGAISAGATISAGTDSPQVLSAIQTALAGNEVALQVVNQAASNPAQFVSPDLRAASEAFSTLEQPVLPVVTVDMDQPNVVNDPIATITDTTVVVTPPPTVAPDPAIPYQGQSS